MSGFVWAFQLFMCNVCTRKKVLSSALCGLRIMMELGQRTNRSPPQRERRKLKHNQQLSSSKKIALGIIAKNQELETNWTLEILPERLCSWFRCRLFHRNPPMGQNNTRPTSGASWQSPVLVRRSRLNGCPEYDWFSPLWNEFHLSARQNSQGRLRTYWGATNLPGSLVSMYIDILLVSLVKYVTLVTID